MGKITAGGGSRVEASVTLGLRLGTLDADAAWAILRAHGEAPLDPEEAREWAIARGDLVLDEVERTVHWAGARIEIDCAGKPRLWALMSELAWGVIAGTAVDATTLDGADTRRAASSGRPRVG